MQSVEVSDTDFKRLQNIAEPLVDTTLRTAVPELRAEVSKIAIAAAVSRVLDSYEARGGAMPAPSGSPNGSRMLTYDATNIPNMRHTKLLNGRFGKENPERTTWDAMVSLALVSAHTSSGGVQNLYRIAGANVVPGKKDTEGYKHVPGQDFSYQGVSATGAVEIIRRCAKALHCGAYIEFEWRNKKDALHPGERAVLTIE